MWLRRIIATEFDIKSYQYFSWSHVPQCWNHYFNAQHWTNWWNERKYNSETSFNIVWTWNADFHLECLNIVYYCGRIVLLLADILNIVSQINDTTIYIYMFLLHLFPCLLLHAFCFNGLPLVAKLIARYTYVWVLG